MPSSIQFNYELQYDPYHFRFMGMGQLNKFKPSTSLSEYRDLATMSSNFLVSA